MELSGLLMASWTLGPPMPLVIWLFFSLHTRLTVNLLSKKITPLKISSCLFKYFFVTSYILGIKFVFSLNCLTILNSNFSALVQVVNRIHGLYTQYSGVYKKIEFSAGMRYENAFRECIDQIIERSKKYKIDKIAAIESRGFVFASAVSYILKKPFIMLRKKNKLPADVHSIDFELEYGTATIEVHKDSLDDNDSVLIIDDLIATGGTVCAVLDMVKQLRATTVAVATIIDLPELGGSDLIRDRNIPFYAGVEY